MCGSSTVAAAVHGFFHEVLADFFKSDEIGEAWPAVDVPIFRVPTMKARPAPPACASSLPSLT